MASSPGVGAHEAQKSVDLRQVRQRVREVPQLPPGVRIDVLCIESEAPAVRQQALGEPSGAIELADRRESRDEPPRADRDGLADYRLARLRASAEHEPAGAELAFDHEHRS